MARFNMWLGLSQAFQGELVAYVLDGTPPLQFPEIGTLGEDTLELLATIYDNDAMERLYRTWGGAGYRCWNCYSDKPDNAGAIRADLDNLVSAYPTDFSILGAWHYDDGRPVGTQWDDSDPPVLTGDPWYLQPAQTINFMPDVPDPASPDPENPDMIRPTELSNVLLVYGQAPRTFTPA